MDSYQTHPKWEELEKLCAEIERLKLKAHKLRYEIDEDLFNNRCKEENKNGNKITL